MAVDVKTRAGIRRQIKLPNREAAKIALRSVRIRLWRSCITMAGIVLAIAFLTSVLTSGVVAKSVQQTAGSATAQGGDASIQIWLTAISLLVCVVGITNAMLMSVTERFREIGTMKCLGALDGLVVKLFLMESSFLGIVGAVMGIVFGMLVAAGAAMLQFGTMGLHYFPAAYGGWMALISVGCGVLLALLGTAGPAIMAARMRPVDALRVDE